MSECYEVAEAIYQRRLSAVADGYDVVIDFNGVEAARHAVLPEMPGESMQVIDNVAEALWRISRRRRTLVPIFDAYVNADPANDDGGCNVA